MHIIDRRNHADHLGRLEQAGINVADAEHDQRLEIRPWEDAYLQDGFFDQRRQADQIISCLEEGKKLGYPMTRLVANMEWALEDRPGVNDIIEYESRLNYTLETCEDAVCCTYDVSRFSAAVIMSALRVHPALIIGGIYQENPFYVPPDEFLREGQGRVSGQRQPRDPHALRRHPRHGPNWSLTRR